VMLLFVYLLALAGAALLKRAAGLRRPMLLAMLPALLLDCIGNLLLSQSFRKTMSGEAWHHRQHRYWSWCYRFINALFFWQADHCRVQAEREERHGSVWAAWWWDFVQAGRDQHG